MKICSFLICASIVLVGCGRKDNPIPETKDSFPRSYPKQEETYHNLDSKSIKSTQSRSSGFLAAGKSVSSSFPFPSEAFAQRGYEYKSADSSPQPITKRTRTFGDLTRFEAYVASQKNR